MKLLHLLKQIACENELINFRNLKRLLMVKNFLKQNACPAFSAGRSWLRNILRTIDLCSPIAKANF